MSGTIKIEVIGLPADDGSILWVQDDGFGGKVGRVADIEFAGNILASMESHRRMEALKKQAMEAAQKGIQGQF